MRAHAEIEGAFTFASHEVLAQKFEDAAQIALESSPGTEFVLSIKTSFLDSDAKLLLLRLIRRFRHINDSPDKASVCIEWNAPKGDVDTMELGLLAQETSSLPFVFATT